MTITTTGITTGTTTGTATGTAAGTEPVPGPETFVHRTGATLAGGPASRYHRVARCDGRSDRRPAARPNYAARRLGALLAALSAVMVGTWLVGEVAADLGGQPVSAADSAVEANGLVADAGSTAAPVHVARDGDTLWSIADAHRGTVPRGRFVDALVELNGGASIVIGQAVLLP